MDRTTIEQMRDEAEEQLATIDKHRLVFQGILRQDYERKRDLCVYALDLTAKLAQADMKLAACTVAALGNTPESSHVKGRPIPPVAHAEGWREVKALLISRDGYLTRESVPLEPRTVIGRRVQDGELELVEYYRTDLIISGRRVYREYPVGREQ